MNKKICSKCHKVFDETIENFPPSKVSKSGLNSWCRACKGKNDIIYSRKYRKEHKETIARKLKEYLKRYPKRYKAMNLANKAIRKGELKRKPCEVCGALKVHAHHEDYSQPLNVKWLCPKHHKELHCGIIKMSKVVNIN